MSVLCTWKTIIHSHKKSITGRWTESLNFLFFQIVLFLYHNQQSGLSSYEGETMLSIRVPSSSWPHSCIGRLISLFNLQFWHVVWGSVWEQTVQAWNVELFSFRVNLWTSNGFCLHLLTSFLQWVRLITVFILSEFASASFLSNRLHPCLNVLISHLIILLWNKHCSLVLLKQQRKLKMFFCQSHGLSDKSYHLALIIHSSWTYFFS